MGESASLSFMLLGMIPWATRAARSGGVPCRAWRRSSCQSSACWQVSSAVLSALPEAAGAALLFALFTEQSSESCSAATTGLKALRFIYLLVNQCSEKGWKKWISSRCSCMGFTARLCFLAGSTWDSSDGSGGPRGSAGQNPLLYLLCCSLYFKAVDYSLCWIWLWQLKGYQTKPVQ